MSSLWRDRRALALSVSGLKASVRWRSKRVVPELSAKPVLLYKNVPVYPHSEFEEGEFKPRRHTYWPPDIGQHKPRPKLKPWAKIKSRLTLYPPTEPAPEWAEKAEYPSIDEFRVFNRMALEKQNRIKWYQKIRAMPTVEEKLYEITNNFRHPAILLNAANETFDGLPIFQNLTRTHLIRGELPNLYDDLNVESYRERVKPYLLDAVRCHLSIERRRNLEADKRAVIIRPKEVKPDAVRVENLVEEVTSICIKILSQEFPHLVEGEVDLLPDIRSWWWAGNMPAPSNHPRYKSRKRENGTDQAIQYKDSNVLNIRMNQPLSSHVDFEEALCRESQVPRCPYNPTSEGFKQRWQWLASTAGYWQDKNPGNHDFPFLSFYSRIPLKIRDLKNRMSYPDVNDFVDGMGVMSTFAWLNSMAALHGFTPYDELTYPLTSQSIVTDGQFWTFLVYQLNTHSFHSDIDTNSRQNVCWSTGEMKLFEENESGDLVGVNEDVIDNIIKFFVRRPNHSKGVQLMPYLGVDTREQDAIEETRSHLRGRFGGYISYKEKYVLERMRLATWERVYIKNPNAPPTVHVRNPKFTPPIKWDYNKFSI